MTKTILDVSADAAPVDVDRALEHFSDCRTKFYQKVKEIREQIKRGRYGRYAVLDDGKVRVNYFVYYDYTVYRAMLLDKNASKSAPLFDPKEIAEITPVSILHYIGDEENHDAKKTQTA